MQDNRVNSQVEGIYASLWELRDGRVDDWLFMNSIKTPLLFVALYLTIVHYGQRWMLYRQPFNFKWLIFVYNISVAILHLHIFKEMAIASYHVGYNWLCQPPPTSTDPEEMRISAAFHLHLISKFIEMFDTVFIIIRKKNNQLTFLHIYHHSTVILVFWLICRWMAGGTGTFIGMLNSFVHVIMYSYYGLSVLGPRVAKYLWWKRYLTILQLIQFTIGLLMAVNILWSECKIHKCFTYLAFTYLSSFLLLFGRFYLSAYIDDIIKKQQKISNGKVN